MDPRPLSPSQRSQIAPFIVMDVMEEARQVEQQGHPVLHLEVGQPGTGAPRTVIDAAHRALDSEPLGYTVAQGAPALRQRIAQHYLEKHHVEVDPDDIIVTQGASGAFIIGFLAAFESGDEVVVTRPGYPCYRNILSSLDLVPVEIRVDETTGYQLTLDQLRALPRLPRGVILASPANPTGSVISKDALFEILDFCAAHKIIAVIDEIYHGLTYGNEQLPTALSYALTPDLEAATSPRDSDSESCVFVINSFSKYFSMTGWRLGWMISPPAYRRAIEALAQNLMICAPTLAQLAAVHAFDAEEELQSHVSRYAHNRKVLLQALDALGIKKRAPADGAFYIYADFSAFTDDARAFCKQMLRDIHVATTPGVDFDPVDGHRMVRFSYCARTEDVEEAAARLTRYLGAMPRRDL